MSGRHDKVSCDTPRALGAASRWGRRWRGGLGGRAGNATGVGLVVVHLGGDGDQLCDQRVVVAGRPCQRRRGGLQVVDGDEPGNKVTGGGRASRLGVLRGLPQHRRRDYCGGCQAVQEDTSPLGRLAPPLRPRPGRAAPTPIRIRILDVSRSPTWLAGPPCSDLVSRSRRVRRARPATPRAEYPSPPTARPERGVPAHAGARDRPVAA
jgi:hypothetical protein